MVLSQNFFSIDKNQTFVMKSRYMIFFLGPHFVGLFPFHELLIFLTTLFIILVVLRLRLLDQSALFCDPSEHWAVFEIIALILSINESKARNESRDTSDLNTVEILDFPLTLQSK